jgi:catalase (peroxidase I)
MALDGAFQRTVQRAPRSPKQAFRPFLGSVQDAQYTHGVASHAVGDHKRRLADNQLADSLDPTGAATVRELDQGLSLPADPLIDRDGRTRAFNLNMVENRFAIAIAKIDHSSLTPSPWSL